MGNKKVGIIIGILAFVFICVFGLMSLTSNVGKSKTVITHENAIEKVEKMMRNIYVTNGDLRKSAVELNSDNEASELPDINTMPLSVTGYGDITVEIFSSPEKAGTGTKGWLNEVAEEFNRQKFEIDGKTVAISVRNVSSGLAYDYIRTGEYVPEAYTPSNDAWGKMLIANNVNIDTVTDRLVGNVAGVLLSKDANEKITKEYGFVNMDTITDAVVNNIVSFGYTNPLASTSGLNALVTILITCDSNDILSQKAIDGFNLFQNNIPFVAYNTIQMEEAAKSGSLDGFINEYQAYQNSSEMRRDYVFTPYGVRHDNPLYAMPTVTDDEKAALEMFAEYCANEKSQKLATKYGFNGFDDYKTELPEIDGTTLLDAQKLWKENKDGGKEIIAVFVADVSGSMDGEPIKMLKNSLINGMKYIKKEHHIGLVSYSTDVCINLPIAKFDLNQQAYFKGAVEDLTANGGTATIDGIIVAVDMIEKALVEHPDAKPMLFVLSDGATNRGHSLRDIQEPLNALGIPVYTIGYNYSDDSLAAISAINEAASINADSDDVVYELKCLFDSNL